MNLAEQVQQLKPVLNQLPSNKREFAASLVQQYERSHRLSPRQEPYIASLLALATEPKVEVQTEEVGDFAGVIRLFARASAKLKFPKITLKAGTETVRLTVCGARSKTPGHINVTDGDGGLDRTWYGRISPGGVFEQSRHLAADPELTAKLVPVLRQLADDPIAVVREHGRLTGHCCFCNMELSDDRSKAAGFGPTCAENFGMKEEWKTAAKVAPLDV